MGYGTTGIYSESAYADGIKRNILANARKTWRKNNPEHIAIEEFLDNGRNGRFYKETFIGSIAKAFDSYGKLTEKQVDAVLKMIATSDERRQAWVKAVEEQKAKSVFAGEEGSKVTMRLKIEKKLTLEATKFSYYDRSSQDMWLCRDEQGNRIVYKTKSYWSFKFKQDKNTLWDMEEIYVEEGNTVDITCCIKAHTEYKGEKQTIIERPKIISLEFK